MTKKLFYLLIISSILFLPYFTFADGGMVVWPPAVHLDQSAQNAIVAWNGKEEIIILSNDIEGDGKATVLRIVPLPSNPSEIKEGSFESFEKLVEIMNRKIEIERDRFLGLGKEALAPSAGIEITFQKKIGAHDVTVVKVNDLDYFLDWIKDFTRDKGFEEKQISSEFREGVANYLKRDIKYFVFDVIEAGQEKESIKPLIYHFDCDFLYYPILISGISEIGESRTKIDLFFITEKEVEFPDIPSSYYRHYWFSNYGYPVDFSKEELEEVSKEIAELFEGKGVRVRKTLLYGKLNELKKDLMLYSYIWDESLSLGSSGREVKALQKILINEGVWEEQVEATGFFGPITKAALARFQQEYSEEILEPIGLETGTGYFGSKTKDYLKKLSIKSVEKEITRWARDLTLGMEGDDVKALQEILIKEGVWGRPDIKATGFFGPITKQAVIKYQEEYALEILEPVGLIKGTGFVGSSTRAYLRKISEK